MGLLFGATVTEKSDLEKMRLQFQKDLSFRYNGALEIHQTDSCLFVTGGWNTKDSALFTGDRSIVGIEGEIYNLTDLAEQNFSGYHSLDTENPAQLIALLYEKFGLDFPKYLNGIFSIAVLDKQSGVLHLCRDHVGSHSLFFSVSSHGIYFSSTIRSLLATGKVSAELSQTAVNQYFASRALSPPATMYSRISAVKASHVISIKGMDITGYDYWNLHRVDVDETVSEEEYVSQMQFLLNDAITIRGAYSGDYGTIVSGGLDSGIVTATLAEREKGRQLNSFSVAFDEGSFSDEPLQQIMVETFSLNHHQAVLGPEEFSRLLREGAETLDSPVNDIAYVGMAKAFETASQNGVNIVFDGEGPDEIFPAGNTNGERGLKPFFLFPEVFRKNLIGTVFHTMPLGDSLFNKISRLLARLGMTENERHLTWRTYFHNTLRDQLLCKEWQSHEDPYIHQKGYLDKCANRDALNRYQFALIKTFLTDDLLFKDERMAASKGVMNRVPLIDYRLVELALRIPSCLQLRKADKQHDGIKLLYKKALKGKIPEKILQHKKVRGFSHPTASWFRHELKEFVLDILLGETTRKRGVVNQSYVEKLVKEHMEGTANYDYPLNALLVFELWMRGR